MNQASSTHFDIAFCVDAHYLQPAMTAITSIKTTFSQLASLTVHVFHATLTDEQCRILRDSVGPTPTLAFHTMSADVLSAFPLPHGATPWVTSAAYIRTYIPQILRSTARVLYLDADILVTGDLTPLFRHQFTAGSILAACSDPFIPRWGSRAGIQAEHVLAGRHHIPYFNSGVLLMDIDAWNQANATQLAEEYAITNAGKILFGDQEILNAVIAGRFDLLHQRWNTPAHGVDGADNPSHCLEEVAVVHFLGRHKPWITPPKSQELADLYNKAGPPSSTSARET